MGQYKEANERMNNTGDGLEGIEFSNFQDYIVNSICKYYFELDPVLKERPNVRPWITNEDEVVVLEPPSSDDDSMISAESDGSMNKKHKQNADILELENDTTDDEYKSTKSNNDFTTDSTNNTHSTPSTMSDFSTTSIDESPAKTSIRSTKESSTGSKTQVTKKVDKNKMSPMQAKNYQKNLLNTKKKNELEFL